MQRSARMQERKKCDFSLEKIATFFSLILVDRRFSFSWCCIFIVKRKNGRGCDQFSIYERCGSFSSSLESLRIARFKFYITQRIEQMYRESSVWNGNQWIMIIIVFFSGSPFDFVFDWKIKMEDRSVSGRPSPWNRFGFIFFSGRKRRRISDYGRRDGSRSDSSIPDHHFWVPFPSLVLFSCRRVFFCFVCFFLKISSR